MALYDSTVTQTGGTTFPDGGIVSFLSSNLDEIDDSRLLFGSQNGINSMRDMAEKMARMGRNGDTQMVHARQNEIMVSPEILEENPRLALEMARAFDNSNVELDRYIVGNEANSINPMTGQREFFLKRFIGGIKKVLKAVAPIIVPIAVGALTGGMGLSLMAQGAISGGITSLVQGGNLKDAAKAALLGGAFAGLAGGVKGAYKGFQETGLSGIGGGFKQGIMDVAPEFIGGGQQGIRDFAPSTKKVLDPIQEKAQELVNLDKAQVNAQIDAAGPAGQRPDFFTDPSKLPKGVTPPDPQGGISDFYTDTIKPMFVNPATDGVSQAEAIKNLEALGIDKNTAGFADLVAQATVAPTAASIKLLPTTLAGGAAALAAGAFDPIPPAEVEDPYGGQSTQDLLAANPLAYYSGRPVGGPQRRRIQDIMVGGAPIIQQAAQGGEMQNFPRRTGYIAGPGTETSDSIPAMLSDGEFVMNAKAVRGAGGGSREKGVQRMYDMMRAFEGGAVA
tara:strand:+ start:3124 stop:4638 length:1515 start_codon:yes stop_codon:yes gene_type:complete